MPKVETDIIEEELRNTSADTSDTEGRKYGEAVPASYEDVETYVEAIARWDTSSYVSYPPTIIDLPEVH